MTATRLLYHLVLLLALMLPPACLDDPLTRGLPGTGTDAAGVGEVGYSAEAYPILQARCASCHGPSGMAGATALTLTGDSAADYDSILSTVDPDDPSASPLLQKATGELPHGGNAIFDEGTSDYQLLRAWLEQGADNN